MSGRVETAKKRFADRYTASGAKPPAVMPVLAMCILVALIADFY